MRPTDLLPKILIDEFLRLVRIDRNWVGFERMEGNNYRARPNVPTWLNRVCKTGADWLGMKADSIWLADGPKVFKPTPEQCKALEQVSVNLKIEDYAQPFPAMMIDLQRTGDYGSFKAVNVYHEPGVLIAVLHSVGCANDITTTIGTLDGLIEESLVRFDEDCRADAPIAHRALRVAVNSCLALSHFGHHMDYLFPKEVESDRRLAKEDTPRGERARRRLPLAMLEISFAREVVLHRIERKEREPGVPTGREMPCHWRRGHWAMVACGPQHSERRRTFRPAVMVRADLFSGDKADTTTTYRT